MFHKQWLVEEQARRASTLRHLLRIPAFATRVDPPTVETATQENTVTETQENTVETATQDNTVTATQENTNTDTEDNGENDKELFRRWSSYCQKYCQKSSLERKLVPPNQPTELDPSRMLDATTRVP